MPETYIWKPIHYYQKIAHDHLKGGKCDYADANLRQETKSVSNTNSIAETDFEMFNKHDNLWGNHYEQK